MSSRAHSLKNRLIVAFLLSALLISLMFSLFNFVFLYSVEDSGFARLIDEEVVHQRDHWQEHGDLTTPLRGYVELHGSTATLPDTVRQQLTLNPNKREFYGVEGKHYHLGILELESGQPTFLVAEVSDYLLVRPIRNRMLVFYALSALVVLLIAGAVGYLLARRATASLTRLVDVLDDVTPDNRPQPFSTDFPDNEIGRLATALEHTLVRIAAFVEREQNFTRDASHELRTPIAIICTASELLATRPLPDGAREQIQQIQAAGLQMNQIIDTLLALAREVPAVVHPPVLLLPVVETAIVQQASLLRGKDVQLDIQIPAGTTVRVPAPMLSILLNNLISNAFHYTESGLIIIAWKDDVLEIRDSGPGVEESIIDRLGEPLVKGRASIGFGLGLSIVKRLCERFGASLNIETRAGHGTRVAVYFGT